MVTSTAEPSTDDSATRGHQRAAGFTLIEISLVLLIISIIVALAVPRLRDISGAELNAQARRLTNTFRYLRSEAIFTGAVHRLHYDLNRQRYWATADSGGDESGFDGAAATGMMMQTVTLEFPVEISDVVLPEDVGRIREGLAYTSFYPDGAVDLTVIHLSDGRRAYTLWINPLTGRLFMSDGYQDVDYGS